MAYYAEIHKNGKNEDKVPFWISSRFGLAVIGFFGFVNLYALRINMSVAIVCMVNHTALGMDNSSFSENSTSSTSQDLCPADENTTSTQARDGEFNWDKQTQSLVLGSFFWGYIVTQIPGGWLSTRFGGKRIFGWSMFICALATLLVPVCARASPWLLMVMRIVAGLGEGVVWPAMHNLWAHWAPPLERSKLVGFTNAGAQVGNVVTLPLAGLLCAHGGGWPSVFYVLGGLGIVWFVAWMFIAFDRPSSHPRIDALEKEYIEKSQQGHMDDYEGSDKVPWKEMFTSKPVWAIIVTHTCANWATYTFLTNMPTYMKEVLQFAIQSNGLISAIPYIGMWIFINLSGQFADFIRSKGWLNTTKTRKLFNSLGLLVPGSLCLVLGFLDCRNRVFAVVAMSFCVSFIGCLYGAGFVVNHIDIAPRYASILFGISNTAATIPGFMAPYVVGVLTPDQTQEQWRIVFYICAIISAFGAVFYLVFGSGEPQTWAIDPAKRSTRIELDGDKLEMNQNDQSRLSS